MNDETERRRKAKLAKAKAAKRKGRTFWLTRNQFAGFPYSLWERKRDAIQGHSYWVGRPLAYGESKEPVLQLCDRVWDRTAEPSARLEPGGGPIRVRVIIEAE